MDKEYELVIVYAGESTDANLVRSLLQTQGIPSFCENEAMGMWCPWYVTPGGLGAIKVTVPKKDVNKAKEIIQEFVERKSQKENLPEDGLNP